LYAEIDVDRLYDAMCEDKQVLREFGTIAARELRPARE